ncbi:MAG: DUF4339 domain-containing protein [Myxococcota bacterium]|nr:DUF4339 domain-containing protein [Myxococcota bacterium]
MWFALIDGEQELGPLDSSEVLDFYYKDIFSAETLLWREGLPGWAPITEIEEFRAILFQGLQSSGAMDMTAYEWSDTASRELIEGVAQGGETTTGSAPSVEQLYTSGESPKDVAQPQVIAGMSPESAPSGRVSLTRSARVDEDQGATNQQRSNTERKRRRVPFIIAALSLGLGVTYFMMSPPPIAMNLSNPGATSAPKGEAVVDVSVAEEGSGQRDRKEVSVAVVAPLEREGQIAEGAESEGITEYSDDFDVELEVELELEAETEVETQVVAATADTRPKSEEASTSTRATRSSQKVTRTARPEKRNARRPNPRRRSARRQAEETPPSLTPPVAPKPALPVSLNSQQIRGAIRSQGTPRFKRCVSEYTVLAGQTINIRVRIERTGRISKAIAASTNIRTAPAPIQSCVIGALRAVRFPSFSGSALSFDLPVEIPR